MKFQKGNKAAKGGRRDPPGGRPSKEQADFKARLQAALEVEVAKRADAFIQRYGKRALGKNGDRVLTHLIERAIPAARQEINVTGGLEIRRVTVRTVDPDGEGDDLGGTQGKG